MASSLALYMAWVRTYSETDRSEVNTPDGLAPAVCASRESSVRTLA
ncbi:MAG TPA: hypothetical protein VFQ68_42090 [Streptosporangiaceae bacterium]|nr:hypothetical protein [Streptosporangiaceae bacterium]